MPLTKPFDLFAQKAEMTFMEYAIFTLVKPQRLM